MRISAFAVDFDETITARDTIGSLVELAAAQRPPDDADELIRRWRRDAGRYYQEWIERTDATLRDLPPTGDPRADLEAFARRFEAFERASLDEVEANGYLRGIPRAALFRVGAETETREGVAETLRRCAEQAVAVEVVSVNWSADLIRGGLKGFTAEIRSSDLEFDADGVSTGRLIRTVSTPFDKRDCVRRFQADWGVSAFVGDSPTDLLGLLEANYGVLIGGKSSARRLCDHYGIRRVPLREAGKRPASGTLYETNSWTEIRAFLFDAPTRS